jgi:hypothetical protein
MRSRQAIDNGLLERIIDDRDQFMGNSIKRIQDIQALPACRNSNKQPAEEPQISRKWSQDRMRGIHY